ncbi:MAG: glycosyl hydrolase family 18 protein [Bacteroidota bacterium]
MKFRHSVFPLTLGLLVCAILQAQRKEIIGYYPSWKVKKDSVSLTPEKIRYDKLTMVNFAFLYPRTDGEIGSRDSLPEIDDWILGGERVNRTGDRIPGTSLADRAHAHNVKALVSIGGWGGSTEFSQIAASLQKRATFAAACVHLVRDYRLDGVDIDWEYPCYAPHNGTPDDKLNFTILLQNIRDSLDILGNEMGRHLLLTAALPAGSPHADGIDIGEVAQILDYLNIMTYDFANPWTELSGHNSPLYGDRGSLEASLRFYSRDHGVPGKKITLGLPFYGYAFKNCTSRGSKHGGPDAELFPGGAASFSMLADVRKNYQRQWDDSAKVPYFLTPSGSWVSFDDEESIKLKADFVQQSVAAGLIIWEITDDVLADGSTPLLDIINTSFKMR